MWRQNVLCVFLADFFHFKCSRSGQSPRPLRWAIPRFLPLPRLRLTSPSLSVILASSLQFVLFDPPFLVGVGIQLSASPLRLAFSRPMVHPPSLFFPLALSYRELVRAYSNGWALPPQSLSTLPDQNFAHVFCVSFSPRFYTFSVRDFRLCSLFSATFFFVQEFFL